MTKDKQDRQHRKEIYSQLKPNIGAILAIQAADSVIKANKKMDRGSGR